MDTNFSNDDQIHSNNNDKKCDKPETTTSIGDVSKVVAWRKEFAVTSGGMSGVSGPIGFCVLRRSKKFVVSSTMENKVKIFNLDDGRFNKEVVFAGEEAKEGGSFRRPSDMVSLDQGGFALRDRTRVMIFNENGTFSHTVWRRSNSGSMCYGIAQDKQKLICLIENRLKTSLHFVSIKDGQTLETILLEDDIFGREKFKSKCRFLTLDDSGTIYVTDLGLNRVYIFEKIEGEEEFRYGVRIVGKGEGDGPGQFRDPAGVCVDGSGNWIVADSKNNRLCIYSSGRKWLGNVQVLRHYRYQLM